MTRRRATLCPSWLVITAVFVAAACGELGSLVAPSKSSLGAANANLKITLPARGGAVQYSIANDTILAQRASTGPPPITATNAGSLGIAYSLSQSLKHGPKGFARGIWKFSKTSVRDSAGIAHQFLFATKLADGDKPPSLVVESVNGVPRFALGLSYKRAGGKWKIHHQRATLFQENGEVLGQIEQDIKPAPTEVGASIDQAMRTGKYVLGQQTSGFVRLAKLALPDEAMAQGGSIDTTSIPCLTPGLDAAAAVGKVVLDLGDLSKNAKDAVGDLEVFVATPTITGAVQLAVDGVDIGNSISTVRDDKTTSSAALQDWKGCLRNWIQNFITWGKTPPKILKDDYDADVAQEAQDEADSPDLSAVEADLAISVADDGTGDITYCADSGCYDLATFE